MRSEFESALRNFLDVYLVQRDAEKTISLVTEDIYSLGTGVKEVAHNKSEFAILIREEIEQIPLPIHYQIDNYHEKKIFENIYTCVCDVTTSIQPKGQEVIFYHTRLTAGFRKEKDSYIAYHLHMSEASSLQEEAEFFPLHYNTRIQPQIDVASQKEIIELMKQIFPGGIIGEYLSSGYPLYFINDNLLEWLGYSYDEFVKDTKELLINAIHPEDRLFVERDIAEKLSYGNEYTVEYRMKKKDGSYLWVHNMGRRNILQDGQEILISVVADISNEVKVREQLKFQAGKDSLTDVCNRRAATELIEEHLVKDNSYGFLLLDIDNFKKINDTCGHMTGDKILCILAKSLSKTFSAVDIVARWGGDEFIVFISDVPSKEFMVHKAEEIRNEYEKTISEIHLGHNFGVSIGGLYVKDKKLDLDTVFSETDQVLYQIKQSGKNHILIVEEGKSTSNESGFS